MYGDGINNYRQADQGHTTPCWIWQGGVGKAGYGTCWDAAAGAVRSVHRMAYEQEHGPLEAGLDVHHECRQKLCINPAHLSTTTRANHNRLDAVKLTMDKANEIRHLIEECGMLQREAAERYGISPAMVSNIIRRKAWA